MIRHFKKIKSSSLLKIFSLTGISVLIKLISSYLIVKLLAILVGPGGIALIGQLQNFTSVFTTLGAGGINNGVVKYVAEYKNDKTTLKQTMSNGFKITIYFSCFVGIVICLFSSFLSRVILFDEHYYYIFIFFGISLILISANNFFISILNGFTEFRKFVIVNITTSILGLIFTVVLVLCLDIRGALIAVVTYQAVVIFFTLYYIRKLFWFKKSYLWGLWDNKTVRKYATYSLMALVSAVTLPVSQLIIRGFLVDSYSLKIAGYWESMNKISSLYLLLFTSTFSVYYLPKLSEIKEESQLRREIFKTYKIFTPILLVGLCTIFFAKEFVINILFTKDFNPMKALFFWQLLGDFFKIFSWIIAFIMVAKSMSRIYIFTEIIFSVMLTLLTYLLVIQNGLIGSVQAYCINYFIYFVTMLLVFKKLLFKKIG
ncbi:Lipid III flippase [Chryseobacterium aquaeductus]|uniref:Lipid III flippase n=1 Tax=Chryseobacterium aquaeductus TaxID=2675056 RepID=A0A9N8MH09_9FLAO|nr:O-antigen translocase [Chryseobacterium aquaeductus]CAA7331621.1 Lipid III flippase [Chryseobacterium potabilaquae]CAD7811303.1 Lipid III flippase [Chryseobacterium aquaeductus]